MRWLRMPREFSSPKRKEQGRRSLLSLLSSRAQSASSPDAPVELPTLPRFWSVSVGSWSRQLGVANFFESASCDWTGGYWDLEGFVVGNSSNMVFTEKVRSRYFRNFFYWGKYCRNYWRRRCFNWKGVFFFFKLSEMNLNRFKRNTSFVFT